jgi:hypothetical protein
VIAIGICRDRRVLRLISFLRLSSVVLWLGLNAFRPPDFILRAVEWMSRFQHAHLQKPNKKVPESVSPGSQREESRSTDDRLLVAKPGCEILLLKRNYLSRGSTSELKFSATHVNIIVATAPSHWIETTWKAF